MPETGQIRVLHVLGGTGLGGAESRIMDLYRQMDRTEIQFDFLVHSGAVTDYREDPAEREPQYYDEEIRNLGGHIYVLPQFRGYNYAAYKKAVSCFFQAHHEFRVVQGHMTSTASIYLPIAKKYGVPITAAHARSAGVAPGLKGAATKLLRRNLADRADFCFACSELAGRDVYGDKAVRQGRVKVIYNAVDAAKYTFDAGRRREIRDGLGVGEQLVIGHVGRFHYPKNHPYLIDIFAALCRIRPDAVLLLLGEGSGMEQIREKCRRLHLLDRVKFMGNQKHPEDYYQAMDFFVLPSLYEGLPGVLVEAQAAGLSCLVSDTVTREAAVTDLVRYLPIDGPAEVWAEQIAASAGYERRDTYEQMKEAGFDVASQARAYRLFYREGDCSAL